MPAESARSLRCAIYTRKSTEHGLDQEFNSLDAQREACEAYIKSQAHEGWRLIRDRYDDGAFSGASLDRPALQELLAPRLHPERRLLHRPVRREVEGPPDPRDEVAPVVEVEVRDRDRVDLGPLLRLAQPAEDARPAVEEDPAAVGLEHVARVRAAGVRPGRRRADDGQAHRGILPMCRAKFVS